ncbi:MAG: tetratricopeptide repeat protein, partial [Planctomycetota bacterium]
DAYFLDEVRNAHAKAWNDLALFFHTGPNGAGPPVDFARAAKIYERTLELFPDHANTVLNYGLLLAEKLGRPAEAKPFLVRYLQMRPEDPRAAQIAKLAGVPAPTPK